MRTLLAQLVLAALCGCDDPAPARPSAATPKTATASSTKPPATTTARDPHAGVERPAPAPVALAARSLSQHLGAAVRVRRIERTDAGISLAVAREPTRALVAAIGDQQLTASDCGRCAPRPRLSFEGPMGIAIASLDLGCEPLPAAQFRIGRECAVVKLSDPAKVAAIAERIAASPDPETEPQSGLP